METPKTSASTTTQQPESKGSASKPTKTPFAAKKTATPKTPTPVEEKERWESTPTEEQNLSLTDRLNNGRNAVQQAQSQQVKDFADTITNNMISLAGPTIALQLIEKTPQAIEKGGDYLKAFLLSIPITGMPIGTVFEDISSLTMEDPFFQTLQLIEAPTLTEEISLIEEISPIEELLLLTESPLIKTDSPVRI